jgi:ABC-type enterobactin transport system permease subunit
VVGWAAGAVLGIILTFFLVIDRLTVHLAVAGILSFLTALVVFLIAAMDHPYDWISTHWES